MRRQSNSASAAQASRDFDNWVDRARAVTLEDVLRLRGISLKGKNGKLAGPCPRCGGRDRFSVNCSKQVFFCRHCDQGNGGSISLVKFIDDCDFLTAVESLTGEPPPKRDHRETDDERRAREQRAIERRERLAREQREREMREAAELRDKIQYCDQLWAETVPLPLEAIAYFARRRIHLDDVPDQGGLRFHPRCPFDGVILPCILARFTDAVSNTPGGVWRRPLSGEKPKSLAPIKDHVIRLWPDEYVTLSLTVGEGVETTLDAATKKQHRNALLRPAWACGHADNLRNFPILSGIECLTIVADADASSTGQDAARACAKRWAAADREADVLIPDKIGTDFNDIE
ncbi:toprim domain-containing protein [Bradyrhizobium liaoningense]|uniref:toprim domain-containing protein n=1 Tax=Bradyrhizobium liaoningense TaxID=43992 RepID=UPI001BAC11A3|nr:toprim domain-containing protein [Bradyrhizobium liaoningense]MBR0714046.1 toprim domain-containing protein [Bradyrhizobium liaoningense]